MSLDSLVGTPGISSLSRSSRIAAGGIRDSWPIAPRGHGQMSGDHGCVGPPGSRSGGRRSPEFHGRDWRSDGRDQATAVLDELGSHGLIDWSRAVLVSLDRTNSRKLASTRPGRRSGHPPRLPYRSRSSRSRRHERAPATIAEWIPVGGCVQPAGQDLGISAVLATTPAGIAASARWGLSAPGAQADQVEPQPPLVQHFEPPIELCVSCGLIDQHRLAWPHNHAGIVAVTRHSIHFTAPQLTGQLEVCREGAVVCSYRRRFSDRQ
jgi:hypothetical protein